jgi:CheY-like chemotaxis protein
VLLVERQKELRDILVPWLFENGFDVREAENGRDAIDLLATGLRIDLVLSCLMMEIVDGLTLLIHVKKHYPRIPFGVVTAIYDAQYREAALREGADDFLLKPFTMEEFLAMIHKCLSREGGPVRRAGS